MVLLVKGRRLGPQASHLHSEFVANLPTGQDSDRGSGSGDPLRREPRV